MSAPTIRVAAIGVNHWHSLFDAAYLRQLQRMPDVQIVGLHDPDPAIVAHRAEAIGHPPTYTDYERMLAELKPDFVLALGRPTDMARTARYLLDHDVPFIMEKPMGFDAEQVRGIAEHAARRKGFAAAPFPFRYQPQVALVQSMIAEGRFGPLSHITIRHMRPTSDRYPEWGAPWMLDPAVANGGCLRNLGPHGLDMFSLFIGEEADVVSAQLSARALGRAVEDYVAVSLRSRSGVIGTVEVGNLFSRDATQAELHVVGRDALLSVVEGTARIVTGDGEETRVLRLDERPSYLLLRATLDAWRRGEPPPVDANDCYRAIRLVDQAYALAC